MRSFLRWLAYANRKVFIPFVLCLGFAGLVVLLYWFRTGSANGSLRDFDSYQLNQNVVYGRHARPDPRLFYLAITRNTYRDYIGEDEVGDSKVLAALRETFPWERSVWPEVIEQLMRAQARLVIFDLMFPAPKEGDEAFRAALEKYQDRVILGSNFQATEGTVGTTQGANDIHLLLPSPSLLGDPTTHQVSPVNQQVGFVNMSPDGDDVIRRVSFFTTPWHMLRGVLSDLGMKSVRTEKENGPLPKEDPQTMYSLAARGLQKLGLLGNLRDSWEPQAIRFAGPPGTFVPHPLYEIFIPRLWASKTYQSGAVLKDKIVVIGTFGNWSQDEHGTPFHDFMPGPEIHLNALSAGLQKAFIHDTASWLTISMILLAGMFAFIDSLWVKNPYVRMVVGAASVLILVAISYYSYNLLDLYLPVASSAVSFFGGLFLTFVYDVVGEQYERTRLRGVLDRYMSKDLVKDVLDNPNSYFTTVGGVRKPVTILFSDVRGFTTLAEGADAADLVKQLNEYLGEMVKIVFHNKGTVDKFIGDAVMAVWGNVVSGGHNVDAVRAVRTALEMRAGLAKLNADWKARAIVELSFGIGINHGEVIVGNVGSFQKMEITVIGDAVNLASRLEGLTKEYHLDLLIGESVVALLDGEFYLQLADNVKVKGKHRPVRVYTVLGEKGAPPFEGIQIYLDQFHSAMELYQKGLFHQAQMVFQDAHELWKPNTLTKIYLERCAHLLANPPATWDGVYVMTRK